MRRLSHIAGMLFALTMAISAFASTAAFALPEILDHVPSTFTATAANPEFLDVATGLSIKCEKLSISLANGKLTSATKIEGVIDFEQCKESIGGFAIISLGDKNDATAPKLGLILVPFKGETCFIGEPKNKEAGIFVKIPPLHFEVPVAALLLDIINDPTTKEESSVVGLITPNNKLQTTPFTLVTTGIKQECDGKKAKVLLEVEHNKKPLVLEVKSTTSVTFDEDEELMVV